MFEFTFLPPSSAFEHTDAISALGEHVQASVDLSRFSASGEEAVGVMPMSDGRRQMPASSSAPQTSSSPGCLALFDGTTMIQIEYH